MKREIFRLLKIQFLLLLVMSLLWGLVSSGQSALSSLLGGSVCFISGSYFLYKMMHYHGGGDARSMLISFYKAEILKILVTVMTFCLVFKYISVHFIPFILSFVVLQLSSLVALATLSTPHPLKKSEAL